MITIIQGGQTGVDRGAYQAAVDNGWSLAGYMPREARDELGPIPKDVARHLVPHDRAGYGARTEANVQSASAVLIVVRDAREPGATPGTAKTIELAAGRRLRCKIVDPTSDAAPIARWIWNDLRTPGVLMLALDNFQDLDPVPTRLLVAGPRESKWPGARLETVAFLHRVALAIAGIRTPAQEQDLPLEQR